MNYMTIGGLKKIIADLESQWTEEDYRYMGKFDDQTVMVPVFKWNGTHKYDRNGSFDFKGYSPNVHVYWDMTGLGLCIEDKEEVNE